MRFQYALILFVLCFIAACSLVNVSQDTKINILPRPSNSEISVCIRDPNCHQHFVVAHRANGFGAPENSREAVRKAVAAGISAVEIDVRFSKDKKLFVMHDSSLDRTTNNKGSLGFKSSDDLATMRLKGNDETIPTFQNIYEITRGRSILFADIKGDCVRAVAGWIAQNGSFDDIVFILNSDAKFRSAAEMKLKYPNMIISVEAYSKKDILLVEKYFPNSPEIIDIGFPTIRKYSFITRDNQKTYASSLVLEVVLPFLRPLWPLYMRAWSFNFLETNNPLFWQNKLPR